MPRQPATRDVHRPKSSRVADRYDETAEQYDRRYGEIQEEKYRSCLEMASLVVRVDLPGILREIVRAGGVIVDLGSGTSIFLEYLVKAMGLFPGFYVGVELSRNMLSIARTRRNARHVIHATVDSLPLRDSIARFLCSFSVLQNLDEAQVPGFLAECKAIAEDGAFFVLSFLDKPPLNEKKEELVTMIQELYGTVHPLPLHRGIEDLAFVSRRLEVTGKKKQY